MDAPDLVIFDCDGVLVDSESVVSRVESEYFATLGFVHAPDEMRRRFQGKTVSGVAAGIEAELGAPLSVEAVYGWGMTTALGLVQSLRPVDGVREVIAALHAARIATCVASQSPLPRVRLALHVTDLAGLFGEHVFTSSMVARPKPAPDLFLHAARAMGADPARCVVVEDSASGVLGAVAAGMTVFGYAAETDATALARAGAQVFRTMAELHPLLAR